jgi:hypothetical protein
LTVAVFENEGDGFRDGSTHPTGYGLKSGKPGYKFMREFCEDPAGFVEAVIEE